MNRITRKEFISSESNSMDTQMNWNQKNSASPTLFIWQIHHIENNDLVRSLLYQLLDSGAWRFMSVP